MNNPMHVRDVETGFVIKLSRGEKVMESLTEFCKTRGLQGGFLQGIGAVRNTEMGYYDLEKREYFFKSYPGDMEVISMTGNIALVDEAPFLHVHLTLSDTENRAHGGHLKEAEVAVTLEVFLTPFPVALKRTYDDGTGLKLLDI